MDFEFMSAWPFLVSEDLCERKKPFARRFQLCLHVFPYGDLINTNGERKRVIEAGFADISFYFHVVFFFFYSQSYLC